MNAKKTKKVRPRRVCPIHHRRLVKPKEKHEFEHWDCPVDGCKMSCGPGKTSRATDRPTRKMRNLAHRKFDVLWKFPLETKIHFGHAGYGLMREYQRRVLAYRWASRVMMLPFENTHIGMFSADQCLELVSHVENLLDGVEK